MKSAINFAIGLATLARTLSRVASVAFLFSASTLRAHAEPENQTRDYAPPLPVRAEDQHVALPGTASLIAFPEPEPHLLPDGTIRVLDPEALPAWLFLPWVSRNPFYSADEVSHVLRQMHTLELPYGAVLLRDWFATRQDQDQDQDQDHDWDVQRFPYPITWMRTLHHQGVAVLGEWHSDHAPLTEEIKNTLRSKGMAGLYVDRERPEVSGWTGLSDRLAQALAATENGGPLWETTIGAGPVAPEKRLFLRTLQLATFSPIMHYRAAPDRAIERYDRETQDWARFYFRVRKRLHPRLQEWGRMALQHRVPLARPVPEDFTGGPPRRDQFLLGPDLLVAPILTETGARTVSLPKGTWVDAWTGSTYAGPREITYRADPWVIPIFVHEDVHMFYDELLLGAPVPKPAAIQIELTGPTNAREGVQSTHYLQHQQEQTHFTYRIWNHTEEPQALRVRLAPPAGLHVTPRQFVRFTLAPLRSRPVSFEVQPLGMRAPGTYPLRLEVMSDHGQYTLDDATVVLSPEWRVLGPFEGGVGSEQELNVQEIIQRQAVVDATGSPRVWQTIPAESMGEDGLIDLTPLLGDEPFQTHYLHTTLFSEWPRRIRLHVGSADALTVWMNGRKLHKRMAYRSPEPEQDTLHAVLLSGENHMVLHIQRHRAANLFYLRVE